MSLSSYEINESDFNSTQYSAFDLTEERQMQRGMWEVDDSFAQKPMGRFRGQHNIVDQMYEYGASSMMENTPPPRGMVAFVEQMFINPFGVQISKFVSIKEIIEVVFSYLDIQEPYFFLVDTVVSLTEDNFKYTFKAKKDGSVLDAETMETFQVNIGWNYPHYTAVKKIMLDPRVKAIQVGQTVMHNKEKRPITTLDICDNICEIIYGSKHYAIGNLEEWIMNYYDGLMYDHRSAPNEYIASEINDAREYDFEAWYLAFVGVCTWLKGPHGLKFLQKSHPVYNSLLDWDYDRDLPIVDPQSGGWAVVTGWTIYTARDVVRDAAVVPGTCAVVNLPLHCTKLVNARALSGPCDCGQKRDPTEVDTYYSDRHRGHTSPACREWESRNPHMNVYISYAAYENMVSGLDPKTKCSRSSKCPNSKGCPYHGGHWMRVQALTEQRTRMLTAPSQS